MPEGVRPRQGTGCANDRRPPGEAGLSSRPWLNWSARISSQPSSIAGGTPPAVIDRKRKDRQPLVDEIRPGSAKRSQCPPAFSIGSKKQTTEVGSPRHRPTPRKKYWQ